MKKMSQNLYCAFCRIERKTYRKKRVNWKDIVSIFFISMLLMFIFWQGFNPKVFIIFSVSLLLVEIFIQIRWRCSVVCPYCSFDPVLYVKDKERASKKVQVRLSEIKESEDFLVSKNPFHNLPFKKKPSELKFKNLR